jgi:HAD superfamily hydrolase (TIGR01549 family)
MPVFLSPEQLERDGEKIEKKRSRLFQEKYLALVKPVPCVRDLFLRLRADDRKIALASSAKGDEREKYKSIAGVEDLLDKETSSEDADNSKPDPDIFEAALDKPGENNNKDQVVVVGDSPCDAEAAAKARLRSIGLLSGGIRRNLDKPWPH